MVFGMVYSDWKHYVKQGLHTEFYGQCVMNCMDFYSCGCILTAHLVMMDLARHLAKDAVSKKKVSPKEAWDSGMKQTPYHSGASAGMTASMVARYSIRGDEFREWYDSI